MRNISRTVGSPGAGLPVLTINTAEGYYSQPSATAEMNNTISARGTANRALKVKPSLLNRAIISTEISEVFESFIAVTPSSDHGSTVTSSWAVAVFSSTAPAVPAAAFHFGSFLPPILARNLYKFWQRLNASPSKLSLFLGMRENLRICACRSEIVTQDFIDLAGALVRKLSFRSISERGKDLLFDINEAEGD